MRVIRIVVLVLLPLFVLVPSWAQAEVIEKSDNGFVVQSTARVSAAPYIVWQALIAPGRWWSDGHTWSGDASNLYISAQGGGCFCELLPEDKEAPAGVRRGSAQHMVVLMADPPKALRMRGALGPLQSEPIDGVLTITLKPDDGGTRILWEYAVDGYMRYPIDEIAPAVSAVIELQSGRLARHIGPVAETDEADKSDDVSGTTPVAPVSVPEETSEEGAEDPSLASE
ncbi:MAG: SRPBCC family protein [Sphingomonadaceae bacterium]